MANPLRIAEVADRLEFIARAKQLGFTLDEITDLVTAWDGGGCGPIQDRLRRLVADMLAVAQTEIFELVTLTADLRDATAALEHTIVRSAGVTSSADASPTTASARRRSRSRSPTEKPPATHQSRQRSVPIKCPDPWLRDH
jgi:hypothetical protein